MAAVTFDKKTTTIMLLLEAFIFGWITIGISTCSNRQLKQANHNIHALRDSIEVVEMNNGKLMYEKESLILEKKELEEYLDISRREVRDLERKLDSKLAYISKLEGQINMGPEITIKDSLIYIDNTLAKYSFDYDDKWFSFNGLTTFTDGIGTTTISNIRVPVPLKVGLTDDYTIFVQSDNPYLTFYDIQGAVVNKERFAQKPKRWNIGLQAGIGVQCGLMQRTVDVGPYVGIGVSYGFSF